MRLSNTNLMRNVMEAGRGKYFFFQYLLLFAVLIFCIYQYGIYKIFGFSLYPDEFGYWASAAEWIGYDWSNTASLGSYYSFGYSLILAPILKVCQNSLFAYRAAVTVNMLMQCVCIGLLWGIFKRLCHISDVYGKKQYEKTTAALFAVGIAVFYPVWGFYTQMTMAEALLNFLFVFICYQFVLLFEKTKMMSVILLSLSFLYLYFVHMRTVGVVCAAIVVLVLYLWHVPAYRKFLALGMIVLLVGAGCGLWIKKLVTGNVYAAADAARLAVNDYAGQMERLKKILTGEGILHFFVSFAGKLYYLGIASFGLFYVSLGKCVKQMSSLFKNIFLKTQETKEGKEKTTEWFYLFLFLSMLGQILITSIYMSTPGRLDGIVYGRYNEYLLPVFIGIGALALFEKGHLLRHFLISAGISTGLFGIVLWNALHSEAAEMYGFHAAALNYLSDDRGGYQVMPEFCKAYFFGIFLTALIALCIAVGRKCRQNLFMLCPILLIEIALMLCLSQKYTWYFNDIDYQDLKIYEFIKNEEEQPAVKISGTAGEYQSVSVSYLYGGGRPYIALIQFAMRDNVITVLPERDDLGQKVSWDELAYRLPKNGFLIADADSEYLGQIEEDYEKCMETASFVLFRVE